MCVLLPVVARWAPETVKSEVTCTYANEKATQPRRWRWWWERAKRRKRVSLAEGGGRREKEKKGEVGTPKTSKKAKPKHTS